MFDCSNERFVPVLEKLQAALTALGKTVGTAESCTGGLLSSLLTFLPGSSRVFCGGVCAYDNIVKIEVLGVNPQTLIKHGAVSEATAAEMASGAARLLKADYTISVTGIAGPDGGTPEKPVGTIWCGFWGPRGVQTKLFHLGSDRTENRTEISYLALTELYDYIRAR